MSSIIEGESREFSEVQRNATFRILFPDYLPARLSLGWGRWWAGGDVVELLTTKASRDELDGPLTIKEWSDAGIRAAGRPGRNSDAKRRAVGGTEWFVSPSDSVTLYEGRVRNVNIQVLSALPESETERVLGSLR